MAHKAVGVRPLCVWDNVRMASVCAPEAEEMRDGGMGGCRPQGGGGVDHPNEVQQRKAQTHRRFSRPPGVLGTLFSNIEQL